MGNPSPKRWQERRWFDYPIRVAKNSDSMCQICEKPITLGQEFRDGGYTRKGSRYRHSPELSKRAAGYSRRAHAKCVVEKRAELTYNRF